MFNKDFYPTPKSVVDKMHSLIKNKNGMCILEPSAGKGDLLKPFYCNDYGGDKLKINNAKRHIICAIEPQIDLRMVLSSTFPQIHLLSDDFLTYEPHNKFDLIIMNPPFSDDERHILKAISIMQANGNAGQIIALCPTSTLTNPSNKLKQSLMSTIDMYTHTIEHLGACFATAERKTNVEVSLISIVFEDTEKESFFNQTDFANSKEMNMESVLSGEVGVAKYDKLDSTISLVNKTSEALSKAIIAIREAYDCMNHLGICTYGVSEEIKEMTSFCRDSANVSRNRVLNTLKKSAWSKVISDCKLDKYITTEAKNEFDMIIDTQLGMDFSKENIAKLVEIVLLSRGNIMESNVKKCFTELCKYDKKNTLHIKGWKTNSSYAVNKKCIIPDVVRYDKKWGWSSGLYANAYKFLNDLDKAMCFISGSNFDTILALERAIVECLRGRCMEGDSTFFKIKFFKIGTLHIMFKDDFVWREFNKLGGGMALPDKY